MIYHVILQWFLEKKINKSKKFSYLKFKRNFFKKINNFSEIEIAGPGFLNIKLSKFALLNNIKNIFKIIKFMVQLKIMKLIILSLFLLIQLDQCMWVIVEEQFMVMF